MFKRLKITTGVLSAFAALGLGGAAIAGATSSAPSSTSSSNIPAHTTATTTEVPGGVDGDNVQRGDQSTPDSPSANKADLATAGERADATTGDTADATAGETATAGDTADTQPESATSESSATETATANDGPGGHADEPGNPNAGTQQQGQR